jgi:hypothetical protein
MKELKPQIRNKFTTVVELNIIATKEDVHDNVDRQMYYIFTLYYCVRLRYTVLQISNTAITVVDCSGGRPELEFEILDPTAHA